MTHATEYAPESIADHPMMRPVRAQPYLAETAAARLAREADARWLGEQPPTRPWTYDPIEGGR